MTTFTGTGIPLFRLIALKGAIKMEMLGVQVVRGTTAYAIVKKELGFKGNRQKVLEQLEAYIEDYKKNELNPNDIKE